MCSIALNRYDENEAESAELEQCESTEATNDHDLLVDIYESAY